MSFQICFEVVVLDPIDFHCKDKNVCLAEQSHAILIFGWKCLFKADIIFPF